MTDTPNRDAEVEVLDVTWFYEFELPSGSRPPCRAPKDVRPIHTTREDLALSVLEPRYSGRWHTATCADLACHEGFYSLMLAQRQCQHVLGVDARQRHLDRAAMIRNAFGLTNWSLACHDLQEVKPDVLGSFDIVLLLGVLYHLENPMRVLRLVAEVTRDVCILETQLAPHLTGPTDWGSFRYNKQIAGCFAIVDEEKDVTSGNLEANTSGVSLFPSLEGLLWLLQKVGFSRAEVVPPQEHHYEQHRFGKRAVIAAYKE